MRASEHGRRALAETRDLGRSITADTRDYGHLGPDYQDGTAQLFDIGQRDDGVWIYSVAAVLLEALSHALAGMHIAGGRVGTRTCPAISGFVRSGPVKSWRNLTIGRLATGVRGVRESAGRSKDTSLPMRSKGWRLAGPLSRRNASSRRGFPNRLVRT